jgi:transmembrane sensor
LIDFEMDKERYLWLVTRSLSGEITPDEKAEFDEILAGSSHYREKYKLLKGFWNQEVFYNHSADTNEALEKVLGAINSRSEEQEEKTVFVYDNWKRIAAAAVLLIAIGLGFFAYQFNKKETEKITWIEKFNQKGTRSMITLSDGTRIWLNSDSKITYPEEFKEGERNVVLSGEAFFNVAPNPEKPFFIHLNKAQIRVVGTSFNVKAYQNEEHIQTSVVTGKVAFITPSNPKMKGDTVFLTKNKKVTYFSNSGEIMTEITNTNDDKEWINGKMIFKAETMESISRQLERNFGKKIVFENDKIKQYKFTGTFDESSLNEILYYLSLSKPFKYKTNDSTLIIY